MAKPFTVIFYIDGDHCVETFMEHVIAASSSEAFDLAVAQAKEVGRPWGLFDGDYLNATEIATFDGHLAQSAN